jgi:signal transduction histidine kinase
VNPSSGAPDTGQPSQAHDGADGPPVLLSSADAQRLLQELQIQRVELLARNQQLQQARSEAESALALHAELYDRAPVGYLTLVDGDRIAQINRAGANLLDAPPAALIGQSFGGFVERMDQPAMHGFLQRVRARGGSEGCELSLVGSTGAIRIVHAEAEAEAVPGDTHCRITLSDITEHRLSTNALRRSQTQLRSAYGRLAQAQERERLRLTEQLHDDVGRNLTALGLNLSILQQEMEPVASTVTAERLQASIELLKDTAALVRSMMSELYPPMLGDYGLNAALRWWAGEVGKRSGIDIAMLDFDAGLRTRPEVESALFRIAQEALENAVRHAAPRRVQIMLRVVGKHLQLAVADDGRGFDASRLDDERSSWGLTLMRERALAIGAELLVESTPGAGTRITVELPGTW